MKISKIGFKTVKLAGIDQMYPAQDILLKTGQLVQFGSGIYAYDTIPYYLQLKIEEIIREEFNYVNCAEVLLPILQQQKLWEQSGRWKRFIDDGLMFTTVTDNGTYCLAPTAEEAVLKFAENRLTSYKNLPATLYQIGLKFRNEIRTRGYLFRGRAFQMFDAYSFGRTEEDLKAEYDKIRYVYFKVFSRLGLYVVPVAADSGAMGGNICEEMMCLTPLGEDTILYDKKTGLGLNAEVMERPDAKDYLKKFYNITDVSGFKKEKAMEMGHIFQLGTKYSDSMGIGFINEKDEKVPYQMGCYGIGVSRSVGLIYENNILKDKAGEPVGFALPFDLSPFKLYIIAKNDNAERAKEAEKFYNECLAKNIPVILDDSESNIGVKIKNCKVLGVPFMCILGDRQGKGSLEIESSRTGQKAEKTVKGIISIIKKNINLDEESINKLLFK